MLTKIVELVEGVDAPTAMRTIISTHRHFYVSLLVHYAKHITHQMVTACHVIPAMC